MHMLRAAAAAAVICAGLAACGSAAQNGAAQNGAGASGMVAAAGRSVQFTVDGTTTYGTLHVPAHRVGQRLAAALLLAGSGPTDRNGDDAAAGLQAHTLQLIAGVLGRSGIMTLRFDKYFSGQTGAGAHLGRPSAIDLAAFIRQADAAYDFLRAQPAADPRRMLVAGHSEGGMYALLVAESVAPHPAGLALIEPQDERFLSLVQLQTDEQLDAAVAQDSITAATARQNAQAVRQAIAGFRAGRPVVTSALLPAVVNLLTPILLSPVNAAYVRSDDAVYPPAVAARLPRGTRVLVTEGTADQNVPPSTITPLVHALAAAGTTGPGLRLLSGVNHLLHPAGTANDDQVLAPSVVTALQAWAGLFADGELDRGHPARAQDQAAA
jgi:acetyl esterase/lipase